MHLQGLDLVVQVKVYVTMRGNQAQLVADYTRRVPRGVLSNIENYKAHDLMNPGSQVVGEFFEGSHQHVAGSSTAPDRPVAAVRHQESSGEAPPAAHRDNREADSPIILVSETDSDPEGGHSEGSNVAGPAPTNPAHDISIKSIITILSDSTLPSLIGPTERDTSSPSGNGEGG